MVRRIAFTVPGDLATPTGGYAYDRRIIAELRKLGWSVDFIDIGEGFPWPNSETRTAAEERLSDIPRDRPIVIDGLAFGVLPDLAIKLRTHHPLVALVHHPLALESGLSAAQIVKLHESERAALAAADRVVVTSEATARCIAADYAVAADRIFVARPGVDSAPLARGNRSGVVQLLSIGAIVPRKGFDVLVAALATLTDLPWRLSIVGDRSRDAKAAADLDKEVAHLGLSDRVTFLGAVSPACLADQFSSADLFVLASRFEGYGMAYAEAIAHGLPVIGTTAGAIPDTVPAGAGILVPPDDSFALARALRRVIEEPGERRKLAIRARKAASRLQSWRDAAKIFAGILETVA